MIGKKDCKVATKSRHFAVETTPARVSVSISSATSSKHFLHSPSSSIGSVRSMPSFLRTLIPPNEDEDIKEKVCGASCSCQRLAEAARAQFQHCPVFQEGALKTSRRDETGLVCCDEAILELQSNVCHLCSHGCYLRAFAPQREWHALRGSVADLSEASPGTIHCHCSCYL